MARASACEALAKNLVGGESGRRPRRGCASAPHEGPPRPPKHWTYLRDASSLLEVILLELPDLVACDRGLPLRHLDRAHILRALV